MFKRKKPKYFTRSTESDFADLYSPKDTIKKGFSRTLFPLFLFSFFALVGTVSVYGFADTLPEFDITVDTQVFQESIQKGLAVFSESYTKDNVNQEESNKKKIVHERVYTIQDGDTLWSISEKFYNSGYSWVDIAKANKLLSPYLLSLGMEIVIPEVESRMIAQASDNSRLLASAQWNYRSNFASPSATEANSPAQSNPTQTTTTTTTTTTSTILSREPTNVGSSQPSESASPSATPSPIPTPTDNPNEECTIDSENTELDNCEVEVTPSPLPDTQLL